MKEIYNSDKICIKCDFYGTEFILEFYDVYGHYIDEVKLSKEEIKDLLDGFEKIKTYFE